jgi:prepilin-type N-terminal cleavage/methylation domain-containing protein
MKIIKKNNGFTLVELIVVIAIIGILAAVLIPTISGFIDKARFSNDVTDAKNMTTILQANTVELDMSKLEAPDIRNIINSSDKNYTFIPRSKKAHFWYDTQTGRIEVTDSLQANTLFAAGFTPKSIEEVYPGKIYLNLNGDLGRALNKIRNLSSLGQFEEIDENYNGVDISHILSEFDPKHTLFVNAQGGFTDLSHQNKGTRIKNIVFADNISVIPNMSTLMQSMEGIGKKFNDGINLTIPYSVQLIMSGAFDQAGALSQPVKFNVSKNSADKIQILENAFNTVTESTNFVAKSNITYDDYFDKVRYGNAFVDVHVYLNNFESYVKPLSVQLQLKEREGNELDSTVPDPVDIDSNYYDKTNGYIIFNTSSEADRHSIAVDASQVEQRLLLDCTQIKNNSLSDTNSKNKFTIINKQIDASDYVKVSINTERLMVEFPNINKISASFYSNLSGHSFINIIASDPSGVVVDLTIKVHSK